MNLDLFSGELASLFGGPAPVVAPVPAPVAAPVPAPTPKPAAAPAAEYPMQPCGRNRWTYKGEIVAYDDSKTSVPGRGRWSNVEGIGKVSVRGDSHRDICKSIDARSAS